MPQAVANAGLASESLALNDVAARLTRETAVMLSFLGLIVAVSAIAFGYALEGGGNGLIQRARQLSYLAVP